MIRSRGTICWGCIGTGPSFKKSIFRSTPFSMISWLGSWVVRLGLGVDRGTFVFDISNITIVVISGVGDGLDTTIGKSNNF